MYVYLAGPITGLTLQDASAWREDENLINSLAKHGYEVLTALRDKEHLHAYDGKVLPARYSDEEEESEVFLDLNDINDSRVVLANMHGASRVSVGTAWEMGYAYAKGIPVIAVVDAGSVYDHLFVNQTAYRVVPSLFEAVYELAILAPKLREPQYA